MPMKANLSRPDRSVITGHGPRIDLDFRPGLLVVRLLGSLEAHSGRRLRSSFRDVLSYRPERLVVDAAGLTNCDRPGLEVLLESLCGSDSEVPLIAVSSLAPQARKLVDPVSTDQQLKIRIFCSFDEAVERIMAEPAASLPASDLLLADLRNLRRALLTRAAIDQAKGILMVIYDLDDDAAFALLVWHSRNGRVAVRDLAVRFVEAARRQQVSSLTHLQTDTLLSDLAGPRTTTGTSSRTGR
ncbi:ANTAR domain-containing protein [Kribbella sp. NPDC056861]|uniref:ANTAR domain-containing protein n=1 Tax=Kribbella sp. NPDC056861 TaxID=3154857 RepID=UPI00341C6D8E